MGNRYHRHKMESGTIDINLKTKTPLKETVTVIVYATYSSDIVIEEGRVHVQNFKMWDFEIEKILNIDTNFIRCFPHDKLPNIQNKLNCSVIINTGDSGTECKHWVD